MKFNKSKFLGSLLGGDMIAYVESWDSSLKILSKCVIGSDDYIRAQKTAIACQEAWSVYKVMFSQFYNKNYAFSRTDDYVCVVNEDDEDDILYIHYRSLAPEEVRNE